MGYNDAQTVRAFTEAESYDGPSLIIAYSHCINMGIDMTKGYDQQKLAVESGAWFLWRFDPRLAAEGKNPWQIDMKEPSRPITDYAYNENRFNRLRAEHPKTAARHHGPGAEPRLDALGDPQAAGRHNLRRRLPVRDGRGRRGGAAIGGRLPDGQGGPGYEERARTVRWPATSRACPRPSAASPTRPTNARAAHQRRRSGAIPRRHCQLGGGGLSEDS